MSPRAGEEWKKWGHVGLSFGWEEKNVMCCGGSQGEEQLVWMEEWWRRYI